MTDIAIRVDNPCPEPSRRISKLYPARSLRACHLGAVHQRPDTASTMLCAAPRRGSASLRDALTGAFARKRRNSPAPTDHRSPITDHASPDDLWALKDVSFEACPECNRRVKRGEVVGTPALASGASVIGRNGAGTLAPARSAGESTLLKILSRITEPTSGQAKTCGGRVGSLLEVGTF